MQCEKNINKMYEYPIFNRSKWLRFCIPHIQNKPVSSYQQTIYLTTRSKSGLFIFIFKIPELKLKPTNLHTSCHRVVHVPRRSHLEFTRSPTLEIYLTPRPPPIKVNFKQTFKHTFWVTTPHPLSPFPSLNFSLNLHVN